MAARGIAGGDRTGEFLRPGQTERLFLWLQPATPGEGPGRDARVDNFDQSWRSYDEEIEEQLDWEEDLEKQYGGLSDGLIEKKSKAMGSGFSKQKQVMEENEFYKGTGKKKKIFLKHSK